MSFHKSKARRSEPRGEKVVKKAGESKRAKSPGGQPSGLVDHTIVPAIVRLIEKGYLPGPPVLRDPGQPQTVDHAGGGEVKDNHKAQAKGKPKSRAT
jgi:hypothetical protein